MTGEVVDRLVSGSSLPEVRALLAAAIAGHGYTARASGEFAPKPSRRATQFFLQHWP